MEVALYLLLPIGTFLLGWLCGFIVGLYKGVNIKDKPC